ncbi:type 1 glutamine amidotransferase domain-containing protein [Mitsuokella sp. AF21-1AC]|uniref:type 1 glutamine amidotransferase domain-containing protein n=1 Tax=Mitsuokella sp. AF21-1AC TaxID=2292235 RepID=UPI000E4D582A|nr:type 1 glutamine amidotransferase domain-containing protein [Mitsuokella sp. AF21-1AC]RGS72524.1 type 1 glutamine amidotransferase domain-containing protein [Mitsuokella sp. AF21-1AC]
MKQVLFLCLAALLLLPIFSAHSEAAASKGKILVVVSSQDKMELADKSIMDVGFFLNEFAVPTEYLAERGYEIVLATPSGQMPVMDKSSNDKKFFGGDEAARAKAVAFVNGLKPISLQDAIKDGLEQYAAIFVPGGHAPMTDLMQDKDLGTILRYFHEKQKPTAFICHGPSAMLAALPDAAAYRQALVSHDAKGAMAAAKGWIYSGYEMTVLSDAEEWPGEVAKGTEMPFHVEQALQIAGGRMRVDGMYGSHVVHDRELITGQNPSSDLELARELDKTLSAK